MQSTTLDLANRDLCLSFLHMARTDREKLDRHDRRYSQMARDYGFTSAEIAVGLGLPESRVIELLAGE
jgi:hypothetical protein